MRRPDLVALVLVAGLGAFAPETTSIDNGVFSVTKAGAAYGTESFSISQQVGPDGVTYTLGCTRTVEHRKITASLVTDSAGSPVTYRRQMTGDTTYRISALGRAASRLTVNEVGTGTHSSKDYLLRPRALLIEDDLFHQLYFLGLSDRTRPIPYVAPASRQAGEGSLVAMGDTVVALANGARVPARHLIFGTGAATREIWIDFSKRLLKVSIPSRQIEAVRDEAPR